MNEPGNPKIDFGVPRESRHFEDYVVGARYLFGELRVSEAELVEFARRYDPQDFHIDAELAKRTQFGGLIASGWHTAALMMRLLVEHFIAGPSSLASPGVDALRWLKPVRPNDVLRVAVCILEARRSRTKSDRGIVRSGIEVLNQHDDVVMTLEALNLVRARHSEAPDRPGSSPGA